MALILPGTAQVHKGGGVKLGALGGVGGIGARWGAAEIHCPLMETSGFPLFGVPSAGSRPGRRPTFLRRQESRQRSDPCFTGLLIKRCLIKRLPCAAHIGRPAQNSPAARAQTAAPESPARCCADQRLRRGFPQTPSLYWSGLCDWRAEKHDGQALRHSPFSLSPFLRSHMPDLQCSVIPKSPFRTAEQRSNRRGSPAQLSERAKPASSAPAACCEQHREVV